MSTEKIDFTGIEWGGVEWTNLCTLYLRAYESRSQHSILHDRAAAQALERIDYDFDRIHRETRPQSNQFLVAVRARQLDAWAADFLARNPDAVVLHLGCGLDSRASRIDVPSGVRWFDVDLPEVVQLRRSVFPEHDSYRMIGASVTDPDWLGEIPADRPVLVIAEGLLMFLDEDDVAGLLTRITERFGSGELIFDGLARWMPRVSKLIRWGIRDGRDVERLNPRLRRVTEVSLMEHAELIPLRRYRRIYRMMNALPVTRKITRQFRFAF